MVCLPANISNAGRSADALLETSRISACAAAAAGLAGSAPGFAGCAVLASFITEFPAMCAAGFCGSHKKNHCETYHHALQSGGFAMHGQDGKRGGFAMHGQDGKRAVLCP